MTAFPVFGAGLSIQYELIARTDVTPVPDGVGTIAGFSSYPAIDNSGNIVFTAHGGPDNNGNDFQSGIYTFINGQFQTVADTYTPVPGGNGATFNYFPTGMQNDIDDGRVAFTASLDALGTQLGLYSNVGQATKYELVEIATNDGIEWEFFRQPWVDGDVVATTGKRLIPDRHTTVLRWNGSDLSKNFVDPGAGYGSCNPTEISISSDATFFCRYKTDATEYVISTGSGYETLVELNTTPIPGHAGETFGLVRDSLVVDQGGQDAAFVGVRNSGSGLYKRIDGGALEQVVDDVTLVPGSSGSFDFFYSFDQDRISLANGHMLFWAAGPSFLEGLYTDIDGELSVIVDDQDNGAIELDGQMEQITRIDMSRKSFAYTPQGYMVVFRANLQSGGTAIVRATINTDTTGTVPNISVSGNTTFGNVNIGTSSTHTVTISNTGNANLVIGNLYGLSAPFSIVSNNCSGSTVTPAASCTVGVRFAPTTTGTRSGTLVIPSNDPDQATVNIGVSGTGTEAPVPNIGVSGNGSFGDVEVDTTSNRTFTINNSGNAALTINSIGGLAAPFSIVSSNCGSSLAASASCSFGVRFAPTTATSKTDTVVISSNDPDQASVNIGVSGTGTEAPVPNIGVSGSGAFGDVEVDTISNRSFTINNTGNAALSIYSTGGLVEPFSIVSNSCGSSLAANASCSVAVRFAPTTATSKTDTVVISSNDPDQATVNIGVSGTGTEAPVPNIGVSGSGAFGDVEVDTTSNRTFTINNSGNAALSIYSIGGLVEPFSIVSNSCGSSLAANASCSVAVRFAPTTATSKTDTVVISSNDPDQATVNIGVSGTGTEAPVPNIGVSGNGSFGDVEVDTTSNRTFTINNSGNAALSIYSIGGLVEPFSIVSNSCGSSLAANASCSVAVRFAPTTATSKTDTVVISSNDPDQATVNIGVSGTGTEAPVPNIGVSGNGSFGDVEVDTTSNRTFTINNSGNAALTINSIGGLAAPFSIVSSNCGSSLAASASCSFGVRFAPTTATSKTDTVVISSNDPDQASVNIGVSGTGTEAPVPNIGVSGSGAFGDVEVDTISNRSFTINNTGNAALSIYSTGGLVEPFSIVSNSCGSSLAANASCSVAVRFAPTTATSKTDTVVISSNDPDQATVNIGVSGTGTEAPVPNIGVSGNGSFGDVEVDTTSNRTFTINNSGNAALTINSIGGLAAPFSIVSSNCGSSLAASASCSFGVRFAPTTATSKTDTVVISSNDPDQASVNIAVSGTGIETPGLEDIIVDADFEEGNSNGWSLDGGISVDGTMAIGQYALRHIKTGTSVLSVSTAGYSDVSITMYLAATSLENGDDCYAEISTNGGSSWSSVVAVHDGNDNGAFNSGTVSPPAASNNANLQVRFRSTGHHKTDYCYGDNVTVMGTPGNISTKPDIAVSGTGDFGDVDLGASRNHSISISNVGDADLIIGSLSGLTAPFSIESDTCSSTTLSPAGSCSFSVRFSPVSAGSHSDTLNIASNDPDQPNFSFSVNGTGIEVPTQDDNIVVIDFEGGNADGWSLSGNVTIDGILAIGQYSLRHPQGSTSVYSVSTAGFSGVSVTMHLAGTALKKTGGCFAEVSTDFGDSWLPVVEVLKGNDDSTFYSGTVSPSGANNNSDLQLRFRSTGQGSGGNCYGDDVIVSGTLN